MIKLIAFDLDGTLLDDGKALPPENRAALDAAAAKGVLIVPSTGRIVRGLPECILTLPYVRWFITVNGAYVCNADGSEVLYRAEISPEEAQRLLRYMDTLPVIYDCYQANWGYMTRTMQQRAREYITIPGILKLVLELRTPVEELKAFLSEKNEPVQKIQMYFTDMAERARQLQLTPELFPELQISSSVPGNIEFNAPGADKGTALRELCRRLGIAPEETIAFGDGTNDISMLRAAGIGVAMANAPDEVKAAADYVTDTNNNAGVAQAIRKFVL